MAELITNVVVEGVQYGPSHGNVTPPPEHAELIGDHCWDQPPVRGNVDPGTDVDGGQGDDGAAGGTAALEPAPSTDLDDLTANELRGLAAERGVKVDKRWGAERLRAELAAVDG